MFGAENFFLTIPPWGGGIFLLRKDKNCARKVGGQMQILKKNKRIIIGMLVGILISSFVSYAIAETLINSKDVVYEDNSNLMADNVQDAIDGTCSKIDTRLSDIEDNIYTIKKMKGEKYMASTTDWSYTGLSVTLPANSCCGIDYYAGWWYSAPSGVMVSRSSTVGKENALAVSTEGNDGTFQRISVSINECVTEETVRYIWAKFTNPVDNMVEYKGFCAIKYR